MELNKNQTNYGHGINIGASRDGVAEARAAINDILSASVDQSTKVVALETLRSLCLVQNTSVGNVSINQGRD